MSKLNEKEFNARPEAEEMFSVIDDVMEYCTNAINKMKLKRLVNEDNEDYNGRLLNARLSISMSFMATLYNFTIRNMVRELVESGETPIIIESVNNYELKLITHVHDCTLEFLNEIVDGFDPKVKPNKETDPCLS